MKATPSNELMLKLTLEQVSTTEAEGDLSSCTLGLLANFNETITVMACYECTTICLCLAKELFLRDGCNWLRGMPVIILHMVGSPHSL